MQKTILLVDDEVIQTITEKIAFEKYGYKVLTAKTGEEAIEVFQSNKTIDLILMDIDLGEGLDGTQVAEIILKDHNVPIVFLSSHTEQEIVEKMEKITAYGYVVKNSGITVLDASIKMAFKLFDANKKILENQERHNALIKANPDMMFMFDRDGVFIDYASGRDSFLAAPRDFFIGKNASEVLPREIAELTHRKLQSAFESGQTQIYEYMVNSNNEIKFFESRLVVCGKSKALAIVRDITERKQVEIELIKAKEKAEKSEKLLTSVAENFPNSFLSVIEKDLTVGFTSGQEFKKQNLNPFHFVGLTLEQVFGEYSPIIKENYLKTFKGEETTFELFINNQYQLYRTIPIYNDKNEISRILSVVENITKRKLAEDEIKALLVEKEIILKEVHHRIKNSMETIKSLLTLQAETINEPIAIAALKDAENRVRSTMVLYDKLYQSSDFLKIPVGNYLPSLVDEIIANFPNSKYVKIEKKIDDFLLDTKRLQPLGILINELLTNIMKYAFIGRTDGMILVDVSLKPTLTSDDKTVSIVIQDNGSGIPKLSDLETLSGFGLMLTNMLITQLKGTIQIKRNNGTNITIEFKL